MVYNQAGALSESQLEQVIAVIRAREPAGRRVGGSDLPGQFKRGARQCVM